MFLSDPFSNDTIDSVFRAQVQGNFGGTNYKGLGDRGVSWRLLALGQTLPKYWDMSGETALGRSLIRTMARPASLLASRSIFESPPDWLSQLQLRAWDLIPESAFIRFLELMQYPQIVYRAARGVWEGVIGFVGDLPIYVRQAGDRFLSNAIAIQDRLRAGGLYPDERAVFNVLSFGLLEEEAKLGWLQRLWFRLQMWYRHLFPTVSPPSSDTVTITVGHRPLGLHIRTEWGLHPILSTRIDSDSDTALVTRLDHLPPGASLPALLKEHVNRLQTETARRRTWLACASKVVSLILTYIVLGPSGLVVMALRLILEGLLDVAGNGRLMLPSELKGT